MSLLGGKIAVTQVARSVPFDNSANGFDPTVTDVQLALENVGVRAQATVQATANSTLTLGVGTALQYIFTGATAGQVVSLGDATTYAMNGRRYEVWNNSTQTIEVQNSGGTILAVLFPNESLVALLQSGSTANGTWVYFARPIGNAAGGPLIVPPTRFDEFTFATLGGAGNGNQWSSAALSGGTNAIQQTDSTGATYFRLLSGVTSNATGSYNIMAYANTGLDTPGTQPMYWGAKVRVPVLSTALARFYTLAGEEDVQTTVQTVANGFYFSYVDNVNSGNWQFISAKTSTTTIINTSVAVIANTWVMLEVVMNAAGTKLYGFINGVSIGSITTNVPTAALAPFLQVGKTGIVSITSDAFDCDYAIWRR